MSRSERHGHISIFQFVNGCNIQQILRGLINFDCKFCLPNIFQILTEFTDPPYLPSLKLFSPNGNYNGMDNYGFLVSPVLPYTN